MNYWALKLEEGMNFLVNLMRTLLSDFKKLKLGRLQESARKALGRIQVDICVMFMKYL